MQKIASPLSPRSVLSLQPVHTRRKATLRARRPCVLWVDDFEPALAMYRMMMEAEGYRVLAAKSGQEALEIFKSNSVDVVITDYEMPDMDGEAVATAVKSWSRTTPVILFSGSTIVPPRIRRVVDQCCDKAGSRSELLAAVESLLRKNHSLVIREPDPAHKPERTYAVA